MRAIAIGLGLGACLALGGWAAGWWGQEHAHQPVALAPSVALAQAAQPPMPAPSAAAPAASSTLPPSWRLLGTMVNSGDPKASMAWVSLDGGEPRLLRVGEGTSDTQVLLAIGPHAVRVGRRDGSEAVDLPVRPLAAVPLAPRPRPPEVETSPIVPPHADAAPTPAQESGTAGSPWAQRRAASAP